MSPITQHLLHHHRSPTAPAGSTSAARARTSRPRNHMRTLSWPPAVALLQRGPHSHINVPTSTSRPTSGLRSHSDLGPPKSSTGVSLEAENLDDDPFAHFLSPVTDDELEEELLAFSAGIIAVPPVAQSSSVDDCSTDLASGAAVRGSRVRQALRERWERYVARYHPNMQGTLPTSSERRLVQAEATSHDRSKRRYLEARRQANVTGKPVYDSDDEGYESAWSSCSDDQDSSEGQGGRHVRLQIPSVTRKRYSSPPGFTSAEVAERNVPNEPAIEYYTLNTGKRVKVQSRVPSRMSSLLSPTYIPSSSRLSRYTGNIAPIQESDFETTPMDLDMPRSPSPEPVPSLGHAAQIAARNEKIRRRVKSSGRNRRRQLRGPMGGVGGRARYAKEPGWDLFTVVEEKEE